MTENETRIYQLGPSFKTKGGISSVLSTYEKHFSKGMNMRFIATYSGESRILDFIFFGWSILAVLFICVRRRNDIFHIHASTYGSYLRKSILARICMFFRCSVIFHIHGADFDEFLEEASIRKRTAILKLLNAVDRVIVLSDGWKKYLLKYLPEEKLTVLYNPIENVGKEYIPRKNSMVHGLFMGRMGNRKGSYDLIEALKNVDARRFIFNMYGDGDVQQMKALVEKYGLQGVVNIHSWVDHNKVAEIYDHADLLVLPSYAEGLPMSVIEGMGRGLPLVASNVGGIPEAVTDGWNGFIIEPGNVQMIADKLNQLIENPELRTTMGKNSLKAAQEKFSTSVVGNSLRELYCDIAPATCIKPAG